MQNNFLFLPFDFRVKLNLFFFFYLQLVFLFGLFKLILGKKLLEPNFSPLWFLHSHVYMQICLIIIKKLFHDAKKTS